MVNNVTVTGGTTAQQQVIQNAHANALIALQAASAKARSGGADFLTWFGSTDSNDFATVGEYFDSMASVLQDFQFSYDLGAQLYDQLLVPKIYVSFIYQDNSITNLDCFLWSGFWSMYALNNADANKLLMLSVAGQTIYFLTTVNIGDYETMFTKVQAKEVAVAEKALAMRSMRNLLFFMG
jgi:hypothetical protein